MRELDRCMSRGWFADDGTHASVIYKGTNRKAVTKMHLENGLPAFDVYSLIEANVEEKTGRQPLDSKIPALNAEISNQLAEGQKEVIRKLQKMSADVFGLGEYVRGRAPDYWRSQVDESREKWDSTFAQVPVRVHVQLYLRRAGMSAH